MLYELEDVVGTVGALPICPWYLLFIPQAFAAVPGAFSSESFVGQAGSVEKYTREYTPISGGSCLPHF